MKLVARWMTGAFTVALAAASLFAADLPPEAPAAAADVSTATPVTLHLKDVAPEDAFAALGKAAGVKFGSQDSMWDNKMVPPSISLDADAKPFWAVFSELSEKTGIGPNTFNFGSGKRISLILASQMGASGGAVLKRPRIIQGPFMLTANSIARNRTVDLGNPAAITDNLNISFNVMTEPRVQVGQMSPMAIEEAVDENGLSLLTPKTPRSEYLSDVSRSWMFQTNVNLQLPPNAGKRIARFKASLLLNVYTRMETFEVGDIAKAQDVSKVIGSTRYTVREAAPGKEPESWEVTLVTAPQKLLDASPRQSSYPAQSAQLLDAEGNAWQQGGASGGGSSGGVMTYKITFYNSANRGGDAKAGPPVKFVLELPAEIKEVRIPVELKDLPLP